MKTINDLLGKATKIRDEVFPEQEKAENNIRNYFNDPRYAEYQNIVKESEIEVNKNSSSRDRYKEAYNILMEYFDSIPEEEKKSVHKKLERLGL
mgnify:CR=1 FL=1